MHISVRVIQRGDGVESEGRWKRGDRNQRGKTAKARGRPCACLRQSGCRTAQDPCCQDSC